MDITPDQARQTHPWADIPEDVLSSSTDEILTRIRLIENDIKVRASHHAASLLSQPNIGDAV
jgi:26S proteasome regulatory subunit T5